MILINSFQVIIRNMAQSIEVLTVKMQDMKIGDDIFLGNDLSYEKKVFEPNC